MKVYITLLCICILSVSTLCAQREGNLIQLDPSYSQEPNVVWQARKGDTVFVQTDMVYLVNKLRYESFIGKKEGDIHLVSYVGQNPGLSTSLEQTIYAIDQKVDSFSERMSQSNEATLMQKEEALQNSMAQNAELNVQLKLLERENQKLKNRNILFGIGGLVAGLLIIGAAK